MTVSVVVTTKHTDAKPFGDWDTACGHAVRESLDAVESVVLVDSNGAQYYIVAEPVEDNS